MKKQWLLFLFSLVVSVSSAQNTSSYPGLYKIINEQSGLKTYVPPPTYILLKEDGSYLWGIDSSQTDPLKTVIRGKWNTNDEGEIRFTPDVSPEVDIRYFDPTGDGRYIFRYTEKDGQKVRAFQLETDLYIEKYPVQGN